MRVSTKLFMQPDHPGPPQRTLFAAAAAQYSQASVQLERAPAAEQPGARAELQRDHAEERPAGGVDAGVRGRRPRRARVQERVQPDAKHAVHGERCGAGARAASGAGRAPCGAHGSAGSARARVRHMQAPAAQPSRPLAWLLRCDCGVAARADARMGSSAGAATWRRQARRTRAHPRCQTRTSRSPRSP